MARLKADSDRVRAEKAAIRARLASKETRAHCVLDEPCLANVYLREVLSWQDRWGPQKVQKLMSVLKAFNPKCGQLTDRQKAIISYCCTNPTGKWVFPDEQ